MINFVMMQFTFGKQEKLKSKKLIEQLFIEGKTVTAYPLKLVYLKASHKGDFPIQTAVSVSKKKIKLAVKRNRIKRLMRECYRKQKHLVYDQIQEKYVFMLLYIDEKEHNYVVLMDKMEILLKKFLHKVRSED